MSDRSGALNRCLSFVTNVIETIVSMRWFVPLILVAFTVAACNNEKSTEETTETAPRVLPVTSVVVRDTSLFREYVADIQAVQNVELRARVQGFLERIYVDEG